MSVRPARLFRAFATVGGWTMASRVLGFLRDVTIAALLGAGPVAEAFLVAFRLPNMFRRFFAEGAFNMAFIPLFAKKLEGDEDAHKFAEEAMSGLLAVLLVLTVIGLVFMPIVVLGLAAGFADDAEKLELAVLYGRIQFPYLLCMSLTALFSGVLNAYGRFAAPAAAPVLLNVVLLGAMGLAVALAAPVGDALALGVLAAGFAQVALVAFAARRIGVNLRLRRPRMNDDMRRLISLGVPGAIAGGVTQVNLLIGTIIASFYSGAVAWLHYADRIYQLPLGVVGVAIGVVLLPELSRRVRNEDADGAREAFNRAAEFALALTLPAAAALLVIPGTITAVLFGRGAFSAADAAATGAALMVFAIGLPSFVLAKVVQPVYFAREDTKTPLRFAVWAMATNTIISVCGTPLIGFLAIPVGTTIAGWLNLWLLLRGARSFGDQAHIDTRLNRRWPRMLLASVLMGVVVLLGADVIAGVLETAGLRWFGLIALVFAGLAVYGGLAAMLGAVSLAELKSAMRRKAS
ncbi:MAG: murein biosynthesis integral membrane protein MurJ [Pikeienuella sp.]